ncbi:hypothetical protein CHS0354_040034 [Potamilus streckersoni]|uniref:Protocadherin-20 n=1 Tax=Potamilus streckersoni TaxID=2493646 RepID=A0AAE0STI5_9BIVA|nr:hypothetical protein CHS0354_040034 [Potamilus streckersoni]
MEFSPKLIRTTMFLLILVLCNITSAQDLFYNISEERLPNTFIGNIANDSNLRSTVSKDVYDQIRYNILKESSDSSFSYFKVDIRTGSLYTASVIDRESLADCTFRLKCILNIKVVAQTTISPYFKKFDVSIEIDDINDNTPRFPKENIDLELSEFATLGSSIPLVGAVDIDSERFSIKNYYIIPGDSPFETHFHTYVDGTSLAKLVVRQELDRETVDSYRLTVVAEDGGLPPFSSNFTVNLIITDVNDNAPQFSKSTYNVTVNENVPIGTLLIKLEAKDLDIGPNGAVIYRISNRQMETFPELIELFSIEETSGELSVKGKLTYNSRGSKYEVIVEASDKGTQPLMSKAIVYINIIDINNNPPEININFFSDEDVAVISENAEKGTTVAHIGLVDQDAGINAFVVCYIKSDVFELQPFDVNEYRVIVKMALDHEKTAFHNVTLFCEDKGTPSLNSLVSFIVQIKDENDNSPKFNQETYFVDVDENLTGEYKLIQVLATDADTGTNGNVYYTVGTNDYQIYSDSDGNIWTKSAFDRETDSRITFNIFAVDGGIPAFTSSATVFINVQDVNDNQPHFTQQVYHFDVAENMHNGTSVGQINAVDQDIGTNGQIGLIINEQFPFTVDSSGVVTTKEIFDREIKSKFSFIVIAYDLGVPSRSSTCSVVVNIIDTNDNSPVFVFPSVSNNTIILPYLSSPGDVVSQVKAYDIDYGPNGKLLYSLIDINLTDLFNVRDDTGEIILLRQLTITDKKSYSLQIRIDDLGQPSNNAIQTLNVQIIFPSVAEQITEPKGDNLLIVVSVSIIIFVLFFIIILIICLLKRQGRKSNSNDRIDSRFYKTNGKPNKVQFQGVLNGSDAVQPTPDTLQVEKKSTPRGSMIVSSETKQQLPDKRISSDATRSSPRSAQQIVQEIMPPPIFVKFTNTRTDKLLLQHTQNQQTKFVSFGYEDNDSQTSVETIPSDSGRGGSELDVHSPSLSQSYNFENMLSLRSSGSLHQSFKKYRRSPSNNVQPFNSTKFQCLSDIPCSKTNPDIMKSGLCSQSHIIFGRNIFNNYEDNLRTFVRSEDFLNHSIMTQEDDEDDLSTTTSGSYTIDPEEIYCDLQAKGLRGCLV